MQDNTNIVQKNQSLLKDRIIPITVILVIILGVVFFMFQDQILGLFRPGETTFDLKGNVYLTMRPLDNKNQIKSYSFNAETSELEEFLNPDNNFTGPVKLSPDNGKLAFVSEDNERMMQVFVKDLSSGSIKQITRGSILAKQVIDWSSDGSQIAFVGVAPFESLRDLGQSLFYPEAWDIYITDLEGNMRFITKGTSPFFSPDGKYLLCLKNSGFHLVDIESRKSVQAMSESDGTAGRSMKLDLSNDRTMLAVSNADGEGLFVYKIGSWKPFNLESGKSVHTIGFWPVFSPDNRYLAFEEVDIVDTEEGKHKFVNPRLVFYDLESFEKQKTIDLNRYSQESMWISDWGN